MFKERGNLATSLRGVVCEVYDCTGVEHVISEKENALSKSYTESRFSPL